MKNIVAAVACALFCTAKDRLPFSAFPCPRGLRIILLPEDSTSARALATRQFRLEVDLLMQAPPPPPTASAQAPPSSISFRTRPLPAGTYLSLNTVSTNKNKNWCISWRATHSRQATLRLHLLLALARRALDDVINAQNHLRRLRRRDEHLRHILMARGREGKGRKEKNAGL